jgi:hypothetical protein
MGAKSTTSRAIYSMLPEQLEGVKRNTMKAFSELRSLVGSMP